MNDQCNIYFFLFDLCSIFLLFELDILFPLASLAVVLVLVCDWSSTMSTCWLLTHAILAFLTRSRFAHDQNCSFDLVQALFFLSLFLNDVILCAFLITSVGLSQLFMDRNLVTSTYCASASVGPESAKIQQHLYRELLILVNISFL